METRGRKPSLTLFKEFNDGSIEPIYVLEEFHQQFLEDRDLTEYKPAIALVGSWKEWERLKRDSVQFNNFVAEWRDELEIKLRSEALEVITKVVITGKDQAALSAAKFIAQHGYNKQAVGRPNKDHIAKEAKEIAIRNTETEADMGRVLEVLGGGKQ